MFEYIYIPVSRVYHHCTVYLQYLQNCYTNSSLWCHPLFYNQWPILLAAEGWLYGIHEMCHTWLWPPVHTLPYRKIAAIFTNVWASCTVLRYVRIKHCLIQTSCDGFLLDRKTFSSAHWIKLSNEVCYILPNSGLCKLQPGHIKDGRYFTLRQCVNREWAYS